MFRLLLCQCLYKYQAWLLMIYHDDSYGQRRCKPTSYHALNRDDGSYLPQEYFRLLAKGTMHPALATIGGKRQLPPKMKLSATIFLPPTNFLLSLQIVLLL